MREIRVALTLESRMGGAPSPKISLSSGLTYIYHKHTHAIKTLNIFYSNMFLRSSEFKCRHPSYLQVVAYSRLQHLFKGVINPSTHPAVKVEHLDAKTDLLLREILTLFKGKRINTIFK